MLDSCRKARKRYNHFLDDEKKKVATAGQVKKKQPQDEIAKLKTRQRKLESNVNVMIKEADDLAQQAEKR